MSEMEPAETGTEEPLRKVLRLGFARGIAPSKWAARWEAAAPEHPLELVPLPLAFGSTPKHAASVDVLLERVAPGRDPAGCSGPDRTRHALRLYTEAIALVVSTEHELADAGRIDVADLGLVRLLDHPDHAPEWPDPEPWADPAWKPAGAAAALDLVASGLGGILLPRPLARHLSRKREHVLVEIVGEPILAGSSVWATWSVERDAPDVQQLVGVMRGRTARSSRPAASDGGERETEAPPRLAKPKPAKKSTLKPNSRGAQLAAKRARAEREAAQKRSARRKRR